MTVRLSAAQVIELKGECPNEDADTLLQLLLAHPGAAVEWGACEAAHTAVIQVLLVARPAMQGIPAGQHLRDWVEPLLVVSSKAGNSLIATPWKPQ